MNISADGLSSADGQIAAIDARAGETPARHSDPLPANLLLILASHPRVSLVMGKTRGRWRERTGEGVMEESQWVSCGSNQGRNSMEPDFAKRLMGMGPVEQEVPNNG